jgi:ABC-2 type transport system ATP-binding protein
MRQRLGIASALLGDREVLILHEPVDGLDPDGIFWFRNVIKHLAAGGRTVLVSSHLMTETALTAQNLIAIGRGRLIAQSTTAEFICRNSEHSGDLEASAGVALHELSPQLASLEEAFMERMHVSRQFRVADVVGAPVPVQGTPAGTT